MPEPIRAPIATPPPQPIRISSLQELMQHEHEILTRMEQTPNGGHLFLIHPFLLLADIGVELSDNAKREILQVQPGITGLSTVPYDALKRSEAKQQVNYRVKGLFQRSGL